MSDFFKGFEDLLELAKTLEEKIQKGELKADVQFGASTRQRGGVITGIRE